MTGKSSAAQIRAFSVNLTKPTALSPRQREIALLAARGLRNKEIARELGLVEGTVKFQMHKILGKLGVNRRAELILRGVPRHAADELSTDSITEARTPAKPYRLVSSRLYVPAGQRGE